MSKYIKTVWEDRVVQHPNRYKTQNNEELFLTPSPGNIVKEGTFVEALIMNNIEDGIENLDNTSLKYQGIVNGNNLNNIKEIGIHRLENKAYLNSPFSFNLEGYLIVIGNEDNKLLQILCVQNSNNNYFSCRYIVQQTYYYWSHTDWRDLTLLNGVQNYSQPGWENLKIKKEWNRIFIKGQVTNVTSEGTVISNIPVEFSNPTKAVWKINAKGGKKNFSRVCVYNNELIIEWNNTDTYSASDWYDLTLDYSLE